MVEMLFALQCVVPMQCVRLFAFCSVGISKKKKKKKNSYIILHIRILYMIVNVFYLKCGASSLGVGSSTAF